MSTKKFKNLYILELYNFGYMGVQRESQAKIDGHYTVVTDLKEFVIQKFGDYAGFQSITPDIQSLNDLNESSYRFVNDGIRTELARYSAKEATDIADPMWDDIYGETRVNMVSLWKSEKHYPYSPIRISANIHWGDNVIDLKTGETFKVNSDHDIPYINRNFRWKLIDRELHPKKMTLAEFKEVYAKAENPLLSNWKTDKPLPKKKDQHHLQTLNIEGKIYEGCVDFDKNTYYIVHENVVYSYHSHVSSPYYKVIDYLTGYVCNSEYINGCSYHRCIKPVVSDIDTDRFELMTELESYDYNTRATHF